MKDYRSKFSIQRLVQVARSKPVVFMLVGLMAYANAINTPFVFDDVESIVNNRSLSKFKLSEAIYQQRSFGYWTLGLNRTLSGLDPRSFHVTNIAIHVLAALCLSGLVRLTVERFSGDERLQRNAAGLAWIAGLLWLVHPLNTESVTYVIQRLESLTGCLSLFGLYALARSFNARHAWVCWCASWLAFALGCRTKEAMISVPLVYVWYDRTFLAESWRDLIRRRGGYYAAIACVWIAAYGPLFLSAAKVMTPQLRVDRTQSAATTALSPASEELGIVSGLTPLRYLASQPNVILHYLRIAVWPDSLCIDYVWPVSASTWRTVVAGLVITVGLALTIWLAWFRPTWGFLAGCFWIMLAPRSSFLPRSDLAVEHRMYLPLAVLVVAATLLMYLLAQRLQELSRLPAKVQRVLCWGCVVMLIGALGIRTHFRNEDYQTPLRLWGATLEVAPHNPRAMTNFGLALADAGRTDEAITWYQRAIHQESLLEYDQFAFYNLGNALVQKRYFPAASRAFQAAIAVAPRLSAAHNNLAYVYLELGDFQRAKEEARRAVELDPVFAGARLNIGIAAYRLGHLDEAEVQLTRAVQLNARSAAAHHYLGQLFIELGKTAEARRHLEQAVELDPHRFGSLVMLADQLRRQGRFREAVARRRQATELRPDDMVSHVELARDLAASDMPDAAKKILNAVMDRAPELIEAWLVLGDVWAVEGDWNNAIEQYRRTQSQFSMDERSHLKLLRAFEAIGNLHAARGEVESAIAIAPRSETALRQCAEFWLRTGDSQRALECCNRGLAVHPHSIPLLIATGLALERSGQISRAGSFYAQAIAVNPRLNQARMHLAASLAAKGNLVEAASQYREALQLEPGNAGAHNNLANVLTRLGQPIQAIPHYEQALAIDPQFAAARSNLNHVRDSLRKN